MWSGSTDKRSCAYARGRCDDAYTILKNLAIMLKVRRMSFDDFVFD